MLIFNVVLHIMHLILILDKRDLKLLINKWTSCLKFQIIY
jgi:hypothetical protein